MVRGRQEAGHINFAIPPAGVVHVGMGSVGRGPFLQKL